MQVTLNVPDTLIHRLVPAGQEISQAALEALVADSYPAGRLTMEEAGQILNFPTRLHVDRFLADHGVFDYSPAELEADRATLARLPALRP